MYTLEKNSTSSLHILCTLMPQRIPLLTLTLICMWYEESNPWVFKLAYFSKDMKHMISMRRFANLD